MTELAAQASGAARLDGPAIAAFYQRVVAPKVSVIEERRKAAVASFWRRATLAVLVNAALATFFLTGLFTQVWAGVGLNPDNGDQIDAGINFMFLVVIGSTVVMMMPLTTFKSETKAALMADIISIFPGFQYDQKSQLMTSLIKRSGLFGGYDHDKGGDLITGVYNTVGVISANVHLVSISTDSKGRRRESDVFKGPVYHLSFPRTFKGQTRIRVDGGWLGNSIEGLGESLERVRLEDPVFENTFEVYSNDQVEARYILTTGFMELLLKVAKRHSNLEAAFFDQSVLIKVEGQTSRLQVGNPLKTTDWQAEVTRFVDEFQDAFAIADELKLNQRIGL